MHGTHVVEQRDFHSSAYCVSLDSLDVLDDLDFNGMDWMGLNGKSFSLGLDWMVGDFGWILYSILFAGHGCVSIVRSTKNRSKTVYSSHYQSR